MRVSRRDRVPSQQGFALVMLAAFLIVASLTLVTLMLSKDREQVWQPKIDTKAQLEEIANHLVRFQRANHYLPCPAPRDVTPDSSTYGFQGANCSGSGAISGLTPRFTSGGATIRMGALPTSTMGLPYSSGIDAWGTRITYAVIAPLTSPYSFSDATYTGMQVNNDATMLTNAAGFVLVSHGARADGGYSAKSGAILNAACTNGDGLDEENCDFDDHLFQLADFNKTPGAKFFDDYVAYKPVDNEAKGSNIPCYTPRTSATFNWLSGCTVTVTNPADNTLHGSTRVFTDSTAPNTGSATALCTNGTFVYQSGSCS